MKKKIAALLRKWANKLNPQVITCHGEDPRECSYIPIKSVYKITPVQCGYIFPHKFGEIINPNNIPQSQMEWAYRHIAEEFAKHFLERNIITFNIRKAYEMSSIDCELEEYFGNRKNLLKDLERVTHGCRHQIEDGIPEGICLLLEHEDVLKTLIACGNPKEIEESIKAGQPMYQLDFEPIGLQGRVDNIYRRGWCYFDNEMFLKCFRNYCKGNLPQNKQEAYCNTIAFYMSLHENCIFLKWQRFAGWQYPGRKSTVWKKLTSVYKKLSR